MRTSQSFPFYPGDFLIGTMFFTAAQVGGFIRLLCFQWDQGSVPDDLGKVSIIAGLPESELAPVLEKFVLSGEGWQNARLEEVRGEREHYAEIQRRNGGKGGRPPKQKPPKSDGLAKGNPLESDGLANEKGWQSETKADKTFPSPSPSPSPLKEREHACAGGEVVPDIAETVEAIRLAFVRHDAADETRQAIRQELDRGVGWAVLLAAVKTCADYCRKAPGGPSNKFVPTARKFFVEGQWQHPETFRDRWTSEQKDNQRGKYVPPTKF